MKKIIALGCVLAIFAAAISGCSASQSKYDSAAGVASSQAAAAPAMESPSFGGAEMAKEYDEAGVEMADMAEDSGTSLQSLQNVSTEERKIILNVELRMQTLSFDTGVEEIPAIAKGFEGYVQDSYVEGKSLYQDRGSRTASFTIRVPVEKLDAFVDALGGKFNIVFKQQSEKDITDSYYDTKARLTSLEIQEKQLLEMLKQSAELEYLLQVRRELANVQYEIDSLTGAMKRMDSQVSMSTVTAALEEVVEYVQVENVPVTFGQRVSHTIQNSWLSFVKFGQGAVLSAIMMVPFLIVLAIVLLLIALPLRARRKRKKQRMQAQPAQPPLYTIQPPPDSTPKNDDHIE